MKKAFPIFLISLFLALKGMADSPPSWTPYKVVSENAEFYSWVHFGDNDTTKLPWERVWVLEVYTKDSINLWRQQIKPIGYPEGKLSNDGKYFSYVNYWYYSDSPVVEVYRREKTQITITGDQFSIPIQFLQKTSSHQLWLNEEGYHYGNGGEQQLVINTRDSNIWLVDLESGELQVSGINSSLYYVLLALFLLLTLSYLLSKRRNANTSNSACEE